VAVSRLRDEHQVLRQVVEQAAEAMEAEVGALLVGDAVRVSTGFGAAGPRGDAPRDGRDRRRRRRPGAGPCTVLVVPVGELPEGRLLLARSDGDWSMEERGLLRAMAQVLGLSLQSLAAFAELQEQQALLERLSRIQRSISARKPLQEVLDSIVAGAAELLGEDVAALRLLDRREPDVLVTAAVDRCPGGAGREHAPLAGAAGRRRAVRRPGRARHRPTGTATATTTSGASRATASPPRWRPRSGRTGSPVGSLTVATRRSDRVYTGSEQEALLAFAEHAGLALNDASTVDALHRAVDEATHAALHDSLTGLPNRALFLDRLDRALRSPRRRGGPAFAVLFIDLDDFKKVNDGLGHLVGDRLLALAGERTCGVVRTPDTVARLGGDEFAVLLEDVTLAEASATAQRVLRELSRPFALPGGYVVHVSASLGLTVGEPSASAQRPSADEVLRDADVAMYAAKGSGKGASSCSRPACATGCRPATSSSTSCAWPWSATRWWCTTSRWSTCGWAASSARRPCCAGSTRGAGWSRRRSSCRWPRRRA
jgi:diguanylate cyclase (GGDEF)-like protein